jgi:SAM-dependent methyltransferase
MMEEASHPLLVNVGCGKRYHRDWLNLDLNADSPDVTPCDITRGLPIEDNTCDVLYCAAVVEHIRRCDISGFLSECYRVLRPGGIVRIAVPDFAGQVKEYLNCLDRLRVGGASATAEYEWILLEIVDQIGREKSGGGMAEFLSRLDGVPEAFVKSRIGNEGLELRAHLKGKTMDSEPSPSADRRSMVRWGMVGRWLLGLLLNSKNVNADLYALEVGRFRTRSGEVHRWVYDEYSLKCALERVGFYQLQARDHGDSRIQGWKDYCLEVSEEGAVHKPDLLIVEGVKG